MQAMTSYANGSSDTGPRYNNVPHLAGSMLNILITLHMPFVNGLIQSASVWFVAIISHSVHGISSESSLIVTRDIHATIDAGTLSSRKSGHKVSPT